MSVVDVSNDLTPEQKKAMSYKLELLMIKYGRLGSRIEPYFEGVADGLNHAYKLLNEIDDDYNSEN